MRIGFDCSVLARPHPPGVVRVARESLLELERRAVLEVVRLAPAPEASLRAWRQRELPRAARELDGLHSFVSSFPLRCPVACIPTLHELPWRQGERENSDWRHRFWALWGPLRAARVITPSEFTRAGLGRLASRAAVIPWGVSPHFTEDARVPRERRVLVPGGARPKKQAQALLPALARLGGWTLAVTGAEQDWTKALADRARSQRVAFEFLGELDELELLREYQRASAVAMLARSEGFGLPVLEALACATHVLVPPQSAQAEVGGSAAERVVREDLPSLCAALERCAQRPNALGPARAAEFRWERTAAGIEQLWKEVLA
jgi:glycosyltransferase involved in cell wall biosynthesis